MAKDLLDNRELISEHPFVRALVDSLNDVRDYSFDEPADERLDEIVEPEACSSILDADSSQRKCI